MPRWHPVSISGYHIREAGSTAAQELAFTLANGFAYVELGAAGRASTVDAFAPRLSFFFNAHIDFFEEIAKYRAARRIWARWMRDRYGAQTERSLQMRFHTQTAGVSLTAQQPEVNIVRTAIEALAGVLGGTQSLHTNSMDETLALPDREGGAASRCAPSRSSRTRRASPTSPTRSAARGTSRRSPTSSSARPRRSSPTSTSWATARCSTARSRGIEEGWFQREIADSAYELERKLNDGPARRRRRERRSSRATTSRRPRPAHRPRGRGGAAPPAREGAHERDDDAVERALDAVRADAASRPSTSCPRCSTRCARTRRSARSSTRWRRVRPLGRAAADLSGLRCVTLATKTSTGSSRCSRSCARSTG